MLRCSAVCGVCVAWYVCGMCGVVPYDMCVACYCCVGGCLSILTQPVAGHSNSALGRAWQPQPRDPLFPSSPRITPQSFAETGRAVTQLHGEGLGEGGVKEGGEGSGSPLEEEK